MNNAPYSIGIDVGATKIKCAVVDAQGVIQIAYEMKSWEYPDLDDNLLLLCDYIKKLVDKYGVTRIHSIGVGLPGTVDNKLGLVVYTANLGWNRVPLAKILTEHTKLPVYLIQDTGAAVWGEFIYGAGRGHTNVVCATIGSGISCGIIIDGKLYGGKHHTAGEIGHLHIEDDGLLCGCGNRGCLETYASGFGLVKMFLHSIENGAKSLFFDNKDLNQVDAYSIVKAAKSGDPLCQAIINDMVRYLAMGLSAVATILTPDIIILSGGLSRETELLYEPLRELFYKNSYWSVKENVRISLAQLGTDAPLIGAAALYRAPEYNVR